MCKILKKFLMANSTTRTLDCYHKLSNRRKLSQADKEHLLADLDWDYNFHKLMSKVDYIYLESLIKQL